MKRRTLRRRLYRVLFEGLLLFLVVSGVVLGLSVSGVRRNVIEDRTLLARSISRSLDAAVSTALQELGRLARKSPIGPGAAELLRDFRFHSPFRAATYVIDARGRVQASDPPEISPPAGITLSEHESVTGLVSAHPDGPVLAIVQPFRHEGAQYHLVSEANAAESWISAYLLSLEPGKGMHTFLVDDEGTVIAAARPTDLFRRTVHAKAFAEAIRDDRTFVSESAPCDLCPPSEGHTVLTVMVPFQFAPWGAVVQQHESDAFGALASARRGHILAAVLLAATGVLLTWALSRSIVTPIRRLSDQAERMRSGDLSEPIEVSGDREIETLGNTLDDARRKLSTTMAELRALNDDLERQVEARTRATDARYRDLRFVNAVVHTCTHEPEPTRFVPEALRRLAAHYSLPAVALVTGTADGGTKSYSWPDTNGEFRPEAPPADWHSRPLSTRAEEPVELWFPKSSRVDHEVVDAIGDELVVALHAAALRQRTREQDEQRKVLLRRLLGATEEERRRIARELHDEIAQLLTAIQMALVGLEGESVEKARNLLSETHREVRSIIRDLRPSLSAPRRLGTSVRSDAREHLEANGVEVSFEIEDELPTFPAVDIAVFRIYQEIVTNILRHAQAEHVSIEVFENDGVLTLAVEDDGVGFDPVEKRAGVGLAGMRERAELVGGTIRFDSEPGLGAHVILEVPTS